MNPWKREVRLQEESIDAFAPLEVDKTSGKGFSLNSGMASLWFP